MRKFLIGLLIGVLAGLPVVWAQGDIERGGSTLPSTVTLGSTVLVEEAANVLAQRNSTTAQTFKVYNTYTDATTFEAIYLDYKSTANVPLIGSRTGSVGGSARATGFVAQGTAAGGFAGLRVDRSASPFARLGAFGTTALSTTDTSGATGNLFELGYLTASATSGTINFVSIVPTYNQASGTAANTDLYINRTQTAIGSGVQYALETAVGGTTKFSIGNQGQLAFRNKPTITVDGATTFAIDGASGASYIILACTGAETINTITGAVTGQILFIENTDTDCTIANDDAATAANAIDLTASDVGAAEKVIGLIYNGASWFQIMESDN